MLGVNDFYVMKEFASALKATDSVSAFLCCCCQVHWLLPQGNRRRASEAGLSTPKINDIDVLVFLQLSFIADGNGTLTESLDASVDFSGAHFGTRTTRFAAIVDDGKVTHANVESNPGVMEASDAATILKQL